MLTARTTICLHYGGCPGGLAVINGFLCTLFLSLFPVGTSSFFFCLFPFIFMKAIPPPIPSNRGAHMFWQLRLQSGVFWSPCWRMEPLWVSLICLAKWRILRFILQIHRMFAGSRYRQCEIALARGTRSIRHLANVWQTRRSRVTVAPLENNFGFNSHRSVATRRCQICILTIWPEPIPNLTRVSAVCKWTSVPKAWQSSVQSTLVISAVGNSLISGSH